MIRAIKQARPSRLIALALWIAVVWGQSLIPGDASAGESGFLLEIFAPLLRALGVTDMELAHTVLRKIGHFSEYLVLAVLTVRAFGVEALPLVVALGIIVPCADEAIQLFVPGRVGAVRDVLIDMCGYAAGALISRLAGSRTAGAASRR